MDSSELTSPGLLRVVFTAVGLLLVGLAIPLMTRRVRPNGVYGLRVPATLADEWVWYEANARSARWLFGLGLVVAALALAAPSLLPLEPEVHLVVLLFVLVIGVIGGATYGDQLASRLLRERESAAPAGVDTRRK